MKLQEHLCRGYEHTVGMLKSSPLRDFIDELRADEELMAQAKAKRDSLVPEVLSKCACSAIHHQYLERAITLAES